MDNRDLYRELAPDNELIPLFMRPWWLDATCGQHSWDVSLVKRGAKIRAALPYVLKRRFGLRLIGQPLLTQFLGPWFSGDETMKNELGWQKEAMGELVDGLPPYDIYRQNWSPQVTNWLPFFWKGFSQTTRYTYRLNDLTNGERLWCGLRENIRREIRKAQARFKLKVRTDLSVDLLLELNQMTFDRQGKQPAHSAEDMRKLDAVCATQNARRIFIAEDEDGKHHAGIYTVWDKQTTYYLMGGGNPDLRNSGATSLCMWEAIQFAANVSRRFDFEGSMIEAVERFFRAFGAEQCPFFAVTKTNSWLLRLQQSIHHLLGGHRSH